MADLERKGEAVGQLLKFPPPPPDALRGEFGRIGVDADVDPSGIGRQVLDPVGSDLAGIRIDEVMDADLFGGGCPSRPAFPSSPTSSFFFASTEMTGSPVRW